jgi:hypothetical protein
MTAAQFGGNGKAAIQRLVGPFPPSGKAVFHRTILYFFAAFFRGAVGGAGLP